MTSVDTTKPGPRTGWTWVPRSTPRNRGRGPCGPGCRRCSVLGCGAGPGCNWCVTPLPRCYLSMRISGWRTIETANAREIECHEYRSTESSTSCGQRPSRHVTQMIGRDGTDKRWLARGQANPHAQRRSVTARTPSPVSDLRHNPVRGRHYPTSRSRVSTHLDWQQGLRQPRRTSVPASSKAGCGGGSEFVLVARGRCR